MTSASRDREIALDRALLALDGLSVGDAFGQRFLVPFPLATEQIDGRVLPPPPWSWTDDSAMALAIVETLKQCGEIDPDVLARAFADGYVRNPRRGYGGTAHGILQDVAQGQPWHTVSSAVFDGCGSMGNGSAMHMAPVGVYFADDLERVICSDTVPFACAIVGGVVAAAVGRKGIPHAFFDAREPLSWPIPESTEGLR